MLGNSKCTQGNVAFPSYPIRLFVSLGTDCAYRLAYCELYIMLAVMALRVLPRTRLHETTVADISYDHDCIVVQTTKGNIAVNIAIL